MTSPNRHMPVTQDWILCSKLETGQQQQDQQQPAFLSLTTRFDSAPPVDSI